MHNIDKRAQAILKTLIERFIREGEPVSSKTLLEETGLSISSATMRNVMADLENLGFLKAPHTSAGRVPTPQGYRLFVDSLISVQPLQQQQLTSLTEKIQQAGDPKRSLAVASQLLSTFTQLAGVLTLPKYSKEVIKHIEFLPLSDNKVLVILVINDAEVQNRVIHTKRLFERQELQHAGNYLTELLVGVDLSQAQSVLEGAIRGDRQQIDGELHGLIQAAQFAFSDQEEESLLLSGERHLLDFADENSIERLRNLFNMLTEKRDILHLLDQCVSAQGVNVFIGQESGYEVLGDYSLVTAPYSVEGEIVGVLGIIGPTRMAYDKVIPIVDITAKLLGSALKSS